MPEAEQEKLPWLKFWVADWLNEPSLRFCSRAARSLWIDMLCVMHMAKTYGRLERNGQPIDATGLCGLIGGTPDEIKLLLDELEREQVFSRDKGVIFCRRMVRDQRIRAVRKTTGKMGGNPALKSGNRKKKGT